MARVIGYCEHCGWPVSAEGVTLTGADAEPREGAEPARCDDTACTVVEPTKGDAGGWSDVASYVATFPADDGDGACDVAVEIGCADERHWFVRTSDDAGGSDDAPDDCYASEDEARAAAETLAAERHEADKGEDAETYLARQRDEEIESAAEPDGEIRIVSSQDGAAWNAPRFGDLGAAEKWIARWYDDVAGANPGTTILYHLMDCPVIEGQDEEAVAS